MRKITQLLSILLCFVLLFEQSGFAQVETQNFASLHLSAHLSAFHNTLTTDKYRPLHLRYLGYDAKSNDFKLLLDKGDFLTDNGNQNTEDRKNKSVGA